MTTAAAELELDPVQPGEEPMKVIAVWEGFKEQAERLKVTAETLTVTDINDRSGMALARSTRLALKEVRVAVTRRHKELKENILVEGRRIDAGKNELLALIEPLEARLLDQEQFAEREAERVRNELRTARGAELTPYLSAPVTLDLGDMDGDTYAALLTGAKAAHAAKVEAERKAREEAEARARAEAEERERIRQENERLRKEAAEREAVLQREREESQRREREAQAKADAEAKKLREEAEKAQAELAAKKAAEAKAAEDKVAAEKAAALAPEKDKLMKFAADVRALSVPMVASLSGGAHAKEMADGVEKFASWVERKAAALA